MADATAKLRAVQDDGLALFARKNADYGDAYRTYGPVGVLVRIGDKISRLATVSKSEVSFVSTESVRDTLLDLHNYAAMAIAELDEKEGDASGETYQPLVQDTPSPAASTGALPPLRQRRSLRKEAEEARSVRPRALLGVRSAWEG